VRFDSGAIGKEAASLLGDPGRYAAAQGYDAIRLVGKDDGVSANPPDQYLVLNRGALLVQRAEEDL
jgi:hypothetical protein